MNSGDTTQENQSNILFGTVTRFDPDRGFGFMKGDDGKTYYVRVGGRRSVIRYGVNGRRRLKKDPQITFGPIANEWIHPSPGDRLMFRAIPAQNFGRYPSACPWGFIPDQEPTEGGQP